MGFLEHSVHLVHRWPFGLLLAPLGLKVKRKQQLKVNLTQLLDAAWDFFSAVTPIFGVCDWKNIYFIANETVTSEIHCKTYTIMEIFLYFTIQSIGVLKMIKFEEKNLCEFHIRSKIDHWVISHDWNTNLVTKVYVRFVYLLLSASFYRLFRSYPKNFHLHSWKPEFLAILGEAMPFFFHYSLKKNSLLLFLSHSLEWQRQFYELSYS